MSNQLLSYQVMRAVEEEYSKSGKTDSLFATYLTTKLGATVSTSRVRQSRAALNVPSNAQQPAGAQLTRMKELGKEAVHIARSYSVSLPAEHAAILKELEDRCV